MNSKDGSKKKALGFFSIYIQISIKIDMKKGRKIKWDINHLKSSHEKINVDKP